MYKSPIDIIREKMTATFENNIMKVIQKEDIFVDKQELIRALQYDRDQYDKGFADGRKEMAKEILQALRERFVASYLLPVGVGLPDKIVKYAKITEYDIEQLAKQYGVEVE